MQRIPLIAARNEVDPEGRDTWDWIMESRGSVTRPFEILLHRPPVARAIAELGAQIRFASTLSDRDRELLIVSTARTCRQAFEWESHRPLAEQAGVSDAALRCLEDDATSDSVPEDERILIDYVREIVTTSEAETATFDRLRGQYGDDGVVEIAAAVGYYSMLACVMNTCAP